MNQNRSNHLHDHDYVKVIFVNPQQNMSPLPEILDANVQVDNVNNDRKSPTNSAAVAVIADAENAVSVITVTGNPVAVNPVNVPVDNQAASSSSQQIDSATHKIIVKGNLKKLINMLIIRLVKENNEVKEILDIMRSKVSKVDYSRWLSLAYILALVHPYKKEIPISDRFPGTNSMIRAIRVLMGPRGIAHGWSGELPDMFSEFQIKNHIHCVWPKRWAPKSDSEGDSSFRSDSSGQCETANCGNWSTGPCGVSNSRLPVTGATSLSDTSSCLSHDISPESRMEIYSEKSDREPTQVRLLKRLDNFFSQKKYERLRRREVRRERRLEREKHNPDRRITDAAYDQEAKRAVFSAAEKLKKTLESTEHLEVKEETIEKTMRKDYRSGQRNKILSPPKLYNLSCRNTCPLFRLRTAIGKQICNTWTRLYGKYIEDAGDKMSFHCWVTPVRWVKQIGPK